MTSAPLNGSTLTVGALEQNDAGAFQALLGTMVARGTPVTMFSRTAPVATGVTDVQASFTVRVAKEKAPVDMWVYKDAQLITYNRVKLSAVAAKYAPTIYADFPTTKNALFSKYLTKNELFDRGADVTAGAVTGPGTVQLTAIPGSFLLTGSQNFTVKQAPKYLSEIVEVTQLATFDPTKHMTGPAWNQMVASVNTLNASKLPRPILPAEVKAGVPVKLNEYDEINTEVEMINNGSEVYLDRVILSYHRVNFSWLLNGEQMILKGPRLVTTQILLDKIRTKTGYTMDMDDLVTSTYDPVPVGTTATLTVFIQESSLRYVGEITIDYTAE